MFEGQRTFVIGNDSVKRCNIHSEKKFFLAREIKILSACWLFLIYDGNVLRVGAIILCFLSEISQNQTVSHKLLKTTQIQYVTVFLKRVTFLIYSKSTGYPYLNKLCARKVSSFPFRFFCFSFTDFYESFNFLSLILSRKISENPSKFCS